MEIETKKKKILDALKCLSKNQIDPKGKGRYVLSLERNEQIAENKINQMYENVLKLEKEGQKKEKLLDKPVRQTVTQTDKLLDKPVRQTVTQTDKLLDKLQQKVNDLTLIVKSLQTRQKELEERLVILEVKQNGKASHEEATKLGQAKSSGQAKAEPQKVLGYTLVQKSTTSKGKQYVKWYAVKRVNGKQVWVYVGDDISQAEEKIGKWVARQG